MLSDCSLISLWVLSECSLSNLWLLTDCWLIPDCLLEDLSQNDEDWLLLTNLNHTNERTNISTSWAPIGAKNDKSFIMIYNTKKYGQTFSQEAPCQQLCLLFLWMVNKEDPSWEKLYKRQLKILYFTLRFLLAVIAFVLFGFYLWLSIFVILAQDLS